MHPNRFRLPSWRATLLALFLLPLAPVAQAGDHGGGEAGPGPLLFTVNLGNPANEGRYLQVAMVLEGATPEVGQAIGAHKPKVQHELILLLSSEDATHLRTTKGKRELMAKIQETVNEILHEDEETGVKEVLFTNFIIQ